MTTVTTELRDEAAQQPEGSRAKRLLTWAEIHFADSAEVICELEADVERLQAETEVLREALMRIKAQCDQMGDFCRLAAFTLDPEIFSRDYTSHINLMGALGDPDYRKGAMSCRNVDLRSSAPKAARKTKKSNQPS